MREFNPRVEAPCDIISRVQSLRGTPELHAVEIERELTRAENKLAVLSDITDPSFAIQTLHAYAFRTQQLLEIEKLSWHARPAPEYDEPSS